MIKDRKELMESICTNVRTDLHTAYAEELSDSFLLKACWKLTKSHEWWQASRHACTFAFRRDVGLTSLLQFADKALFGKGQGYASEATFLGNFYRYAREFNKSPQWVIQFLIFKHIDFLQESLKTGQIHGPEGVLERVGDIIVYNALGYAADQMGV